LQNAQAQFLRDEIKWRDEERTGVLTLPERLEALHDAAGAFEPHIGFRKSIRSEHLAQHEGKARGKRVDRQDFTPQVRVARDDGLDDEAEKGVVSAHEDK
jgi:hypothetical protein